MDERQRGAVLDTVPAILEKQAFLFADPIPEGGFRAQGEEYLAASISFEGPACGGVLAAFPETLARELAANLLGADPGDGKAAEFSADAVGEFLNVACGHLLTALFGTGPAFNLGAPRVFSIPAELADRLARKPDVVGFEVDGAPIIFQASFHAALEAEGARDA